MTFHSPQIPANHNQNPKAAPLLNSTHGAETLFHSCEEEGGGGQGERTNQVLGPDAPSTDPLAPAVRHSSCCPLHVNRPSHPPTHNPRAPPLANPLSIFLFCISFVYETTIKRGLIFYTSCVSALLHFTSVSYLSCCSVCRNKCDWPKAPESRVSRCRRDLTSNVNIILLKSVFRCSNWIFYKTCFFWVCEFRKTSRSTLTDFKEDPLQCGQLSTRWQHTAELRLGGRADTRCATGHRNVTSQPLPWSPS